MSELDEQITESVKKFFESLQGDKLPEWPYIVTSGGCEKKVQPWYWNKLRKTLPSNLYAMPEVSIGNKRTLDFVVYEKGVHVHKGYKAAIEFKFNYITQRSEFNGRLRKAFKQQRLPINSYVDNKNLYVIYLLAGLFDRGNASLMGAVEKQYHKYVSKQKKEITPEKQMEAAGKAMEEHGEKCIHKSTLVFSLVKVGKEKIGDTNFDVGVAVLLFKQCV